MPKPGDAIHIPIPPEDAIGMFMRVKPTADMPRPSDGKKPGKRGEDKGGSARREMGNEKRPRAKRGRSKQRS